MKVHATVHTQMHTHTNTCAHTHKYMYTHTQTPHNMPLLPSTSLKAPPSTGLSTLQGVAVTPPREHPPPHSTHPGLCPEVWPAAHSVCRESLPVMQEASRHAPECHTAGQMGPYCWHQHQNKHSLFSHVWVSQRIWPIFGGVASLFSRSFAIGLLCDHMCV